MTRADVTSLLSAWSLGDPAALNAAIPMIYAELRRLAAAQLRCERQNHTLQPTALVNEAVIRLIGKKPTFLESRKQLIGVLGHAMREVLVDSARRKLADKRAHNVENLDVEALEISKGEVSVLSLDDALNLLAKIQPRQAQVVELKFFGGLTLDEIAEVVDASTATVTRDWRLARAWLKREMTQSEAD